MINSKIVVLILLIPVYIFPAGFLTCPAADSTAIQTNDGKIIKNIFINNIDVAGPSIEDDNNWEPDLFGKLGNALHFKTRIQVIRNILLFKEGQNSDPYKIKESERLLRQSGYFYDARIDVEKTDEPGKVNVTVITKDKWTLTPRLSYSPQRKHGYIGLSDNNLLGMGHSAGINISRDEDPHIGWGGELNYTVNNIKGSFVNASAGIASNNKSNLFRIGLDRTFYTTAARWAGGLNFTWQHDELRFVDNNTISLIPHSYDTQDLWIGRSFPVLFGSTQFRKNTSFILSGRYYRKHYTIRPNVLPDSNKIFENNRLYLFSIGLINREFYKSFYVNEFGVTEDIPIGGLFSFTTGSDSREFYNRWYFGMQILYSSLLKRLGYFSGNFELGGFRSSDAWEQNTIRLDLIYHSFLFQQNNWKARFFFGNNFVLGFNRFTGEQIYLERTTGMPGFNEFSAAGVKRNVTNLELRFFTPYNVLGFVIGGTIFADYGLISGAGRSLLSGRLYQGYGFGMRTQNESISKTNFEIALVYNPYNPVSGRGETQVIFNASFVLGSRNFNFNEPMTVEFSSYK